MQSVLVEHGVSLLKIALRLSVRVSQQFAPSVNIPLLLLRPSRENLLLLKGIEMSTSRLASVVSAFSRLQSLSRARLFDQAMHAQFGLIVRENPALCRLNAIKV